MITLVLADDHPLLRDGLKARMASEEEIDVIGEAETGVEAQSVCAKLQPDIVLLDINMPEQNGIQVIGHIVRESPGTRVIILSMHDDAQYLRGALRAGAKGYVLKDAGGAEIVRAIHAVHAGGTYFSEAMSHQLLDGDIDACESASLTERELEVLTLLADGLTNKHIARQLNISPRTVESHRANIKSKLGASSFAEMLRYAVEQGILSNP